MKAAIRQRAQELGFDECRFTTAQAPGSAPKLREWLAQGRHGEMGYLERNAQKRVDPAQVLRDAKSIVVLGVSYYRGSLRAVHNYEVFEQSSSRFSAAQGEGGGGDHNGNVGSSLRGTIARYAQYRDYHHVLAPGLKGLSEFILRIGPEGTRCSWYTDTGPVLERALAQRAGLGFAGKHTNLVSRQYGNWLFLAELITTLETEPDAPQKNLCGSCTRCITACPTGAITAPFQLDARRCISYLTIELKGPIPEDLRPGVGRHIYGCDICLEACPWNRFAREGAIMKEHSREELGAPDLLKLLALDDAEFKRRFEGTSMLRAKRRGLLRNVCVALGNIGDQRALPALKKARGDCEPLIAEHAAWAMREIERRAEGRGNVKVSLKPEAQL